MRTQKNATTDDRPLELEHPGHDGDEPPRRVGWGQRVGVYAVVVAIVLLVLAIGSLHPSPHHDDVRPPPPSGGPAPGPQPGQAGLRLVTLDGKIDEALHLPADAWMADLSPDGRRVAFLTWSTSVGVCGGCGDHIRLAIVPIDRTSGAFLYLGRGGGGLRRLNDPAWSPDGTRIAFSAARGGNTDIYVATVGRRLGFGFGFSAPTLRVTTDPAVDDAPAWSPDGSTIYYDNLGSAPADENGTSRTEEIWSVPATGGTPWRLTWNSMPDARPDVGPDGDVAYSRDGVLYTMGGLGGGQFPLLTPNVIRGTDPRWSPDGQSIAFLLPAGSQRAVFSDRVVGDADLPLHEVAVVDLRSSAVTGLGDQVAGDANPVSWIARRPALLVTAYRVGPS